MQKILYDISNVDFAYEVDKPVLHIERLRIKKNQLIFFIGPSGVGKSTLIESLGLMSNTISPGKSSKCNFLAEGKEYNLLESSNWSDTEKSRIRRDRFSFIFQDTNLLDYFSAGENMSMNRMLQGSTLRSCKDEIQDLAFQLNLPKDVFDRSITQLSGGQRQRLTFIRGISADFDVLFCDEPTGNLDPGVARKMMSFLKSTLKAKQKTALIVTHDILLALEMADIIIPIGFNTYEGSACGEISKYFYKNGNDWINEKGDSVEEFNLDFIFRNFFHEGNK